MPVLVVLQGVVRWKGPGVSVCWGRGARWAWETWQGRGRGTEGGEQVRGWAPRSQALGREELRGALGAWEPDSLGRTEGYGAERDLRKSRVGVCRGAGMGE